MSVGFGFSVGDFLATIKLVGTITDALREASQSTTKFHDLLRELEALDTALNHVRKVEFDDSQRFKKLALYQAASQCQRSIDAFWSKVQKYQPHLSKSGTGSRMKDDWAKIKWAVFKTKDVDTFRAEIRGHTASIQLLMEAIHAQNQRRQYKSLAGMIQVLSFQVMARLRTISDAVGQTVQQSTGLVKTCTKILETNLRVFQMVYDIHLFITQLPAQVERQQPVYFTDVFNRQAPFHLEFIRSAEALLAVIKTNFKTLGCHPNLVNTDFFVIEEAGTYRHIDITKDWEHCFYPGQRVAMSMVFGISFSLSCEYITTFCPECKTQSNSKAESAEVSW